MMIQLSKDKGFTIIEVMIALVVLSFGLLALGKLTASTISGNHFAAQLSAATTLAQDKLEDVKQGSYASIASETETGVDEQANSGGIFDRVTQVSDDQPASGMKTVTVTVSWDWNGSSHDVVLKTIVANVEQ